ncbi:MAG: acetate--CoA ligase family protein, partial [Clostridiales bacterium]
NYLAKKSVMVEEPAPKGTLPTGSHVVLEPDGMALLKDAGVPVPAFRFVKEEADVAKACEEIGYPICIKVVSPDIIHKSDFGGVKLNIKNADEAIAAYHHMQKISEGLDFRGIIVYPMLKMGTEVILGLTRDVQFGPVIVFGLGGIYSEVLKDIVLRVAPVNKDQAMEMIQSIKAYPILKGIRGQAGADLDSLADAIVAFSRLPFEYPDINEADLNPVSAGSDGCVVVDARILGKKQK